MSVFYNDQKVRNAYILVSAVGLGMSLVGYSLDQFPGTPAREWLWTAGGVILQSLHLFLPRPEIMMDPHCPILVRIAAFLCGTSGFLAATMVWIRVANRSVADIVTQFFQNGHVVVIGGGDFGTRFTETLARARRAVVQAVDDAGSDAPPASYRISLPLTVDRLLRRTRMAKSKTAVVDMGDDTGSMAKAAAIVSSLKSSSTLQKIAVRVTDPVLSDRFLDHLHEHHGSSAVEVNVFDENRIMARHVLDQTPLFRRAAERGQKRVHALIIGFGDLGEKLMDQVLLTSLTHDLEPPRVTIVDRAAEARRREFCARRPRVLASFEEAEFPDINFVEFDLNALPCMEDVTEGPAKPLHEAAEEDPFTMIYVAVSDYGEVVRTALMLRRLQAQFGAFCAPISYRCRLDGETEDVLYQSPSPGFGAETGFFRMSMPEADLLEELLGNEKLDRYAERFHEAYRKLGFVSPGADKDWKALPDMFKRANRRAADHIPAKAHAMGIKMAQDAPLHEVDIRRLRELLDHPDTSQDMLTLARLEHARWRIDRYLDGWTYGPENDDLKRTRTTLVPFADLMDRPEEVKKDVDQVRMLLEILLEDDLSA